MLDKHTRLVEVTVCGHKEEWRAAKYPYPPEALEKLERARRLAHPDVSEPVSDPKDAPAPLLSEDGRFSAESSECCICKMPLVTRPGVAGPFTVGFSLQVTLRTHAAPPLAACNTICFYPCALQQYYVHFHPLHQNEDEQEVEDEPDIVLHAADQSAPTCDGHSRILLRQLMCLAADGSPLKWRNGQQFFPHVVHDVCARNNFRSMPTAKCPVSCSLGSSKFNPSFVPVQAPPDAPPDDQTLQDMADAMHDPRQCPICSRGPVDYRGCSDLTRHRHGISDNACPSCGFFGRFLSEWPR